MSKQSDREEEEPHFSQVPFTPLSPKDRAKRDNHKDPDNAVGTVQDHLKRQRGDA